MVTYFGGGERNGDVGEVDGFRRPEPYGYNRQTRLGANQQPYDRPTSPGSVSPLSSVMSGSQQAENYPTPYIDHSGFDEQERRPQHQQHSTYEDLGTGHHYQTQPMGTDHQSHRYSGGLPHGADFPAPELNDGGEEENRRELNDDAAMLAHGAATRDPGSRHSSGRYHVFSRWAWEIASLILAALLLVAMVVILHEFEGQRVPDWGEWVNLNTIVAVLSTVLRGAVAVVIAEILSQAKWEWFAAGQPRPLRDLQDFDAGSRGVWGALCLLPTVVKGDAVALLAALLLAASFAVGPTAQQAIRSAVCEYADDGNATLAYAHYVPRAGGYVRGYPGRSGVADSDAMVAISSSLNFPEGTENAVTATCATGNCTFTGGDPVANRDLRPGMASNRSRNVDVTSHSTMGLCHRCLDVTPLVELYETGATHRDFGLPNGLNVTWGPFGVELNTTTEPDYLDWAADLMTPEFAAASRWSLTNITILAISEAGCDEGGRSGCPAPGRLGDTEVAGEVGLSGVTCVLYPCVRSYVAAVTGGQLREEEVGTPIAATPDLGTSKDDMSSQEERLDIMSGYNGFFNTNAHYTAVKSPCLANGTVYDDEAAMADAEWTTRLALYEESTDGRPTARNITAPEGCIYRHNAEFGKAVGTAFGDLLEGSCMIDPRTGPGCTQRSTPGRYHKPLERLYNDRRASFGSIDAYFGSVTAAMTRRYRVTYGSDGIMEGGTRDVSTRPIYDDQQEEGGGEEGTLPRGLVRGITWQTSVCTVVHWEWLSFSASLVGLTSVLLALTIARSWRSRHIRPVWKANLLPLLFHGDRFSLGQGPLLLAPMAQRSSRPGGARFKEVPATAEETYISNEGSQRLMEDKEMEQQAARVMATFQWPKMGARQPGDDEAAAAAAAQGTGFWTGRRNRSGRKRLRQWDTDSLAQQEP